MPGCAMDCGFVLCTKRFNFTRRLFCEIVCRYRCDRCFMIRISSLIGTVVALTMPRSSHSFLGGSKPVEDIFSCTIFTQIIYDKSSWWRGCFTTRCISLTITSVRLPVAGLRWSRHQTLHLWFMIIFFNSSPHLYFVCG